MKHSLKVKTAQFVIGGLLFSLMALSLIGWKVRAGSSAPSAIITVNSTADGPPANNGQCTLREAIINANFNTQSGSTDCAAGNGADTISFSLPAGPQTINLTSELPDITASLTITGPGANNLTVQRGTGGEYGIFSFPGTNHANTVSGLTIRNGLTPGSGGGIYSAGALTLIDCVITDNHAQVGGGVQLVFGSGTFTNCAISNNTADLQGGGINYQGSTGHALTLTNCTISGNTANGFGSGGGILNLSGLNTTSTMEVVNCTIANNISSTSNGGGIRTSGGPGSPTTTVLRNTIIANNTLPNLTIASTATVDSQGYNLASDGGGGFLTQPTDQVNQDPLLAPLGNYGGSSPTQALLPGSPAINSGTNTGAPATDQRGIARVGVTDIGAFESRGFNLTASSGNNQTALPGAAFANPLTVTVSSSFSEPVVGGQVAFLTPVGGASALLAPNPAAIGANNRATATATANNQAGSYQVTATTGSNSVAFALTNFSCPSIAISPATSTLSAGAAGQFYSQIFTQTGGTGAITWTVTAGTLPGNLSLNPASGLLAGTPTTFGAFNFTVTATDANGCTGARAYTLTISPPCTTLTVNPATLENGTFGQTYSAMISGASGVAPYTFTVSGGALPDGLSLNASTGAISGTPTQAAIFNFTIRTTDANNCTGARAYTITINAGAANNGLQFYPLAAPVRLLDTRAGQTGCSAPGAPIPGGTSRTQAASGFCSIPANARALTGNITTVQSGGGYLTLYPSDAAQPLVANSNYNANEIVNNVFTVGLGAGSGTFKIFVTSDTHVVVDVTGYYAPPAASGLYFHPLPKPIRLLETRMGFSGCAVPGAPLEGGENTTQSAHLTCDGVTIPATAQAITGNATTVNPSGPGFPYLTLFPADAARPLVASSNYLPGQIMNAPFTVGLSGTGEFKIYPTTRTDLVIDVLGYYSEDAVDANGAGLLFNPLPKPVRLLETRAGFPACFVTGAPLLAGSTRTQAARGTCDGAEIAANALGIVGNATVVNSGGGYLTFWPGTAAQPTVATSNFNSGQIFNRHFTVGLGTGDGAFNIFTQFQTDLVIDVSGYFAP